MKKIIIYVFSCALIGLLLSYYMFKQYDFEEAISETENIYFLESGIYSNIEDMKNNTKLTYYIYSEEKDGYHVYVGITKDNLEKIKKFYKDYDLNVREFNINDSKFIEILKQYDNLLATTEETKIIENIIYQVLSKYEELEINE